MCKATHDLNTTVVEDMLAVDQTASREGFHQPGPHGERVIPYDAVGGIYIIPWQRVCIWDTQDTILQSLA